MSLSSHINSALFTTAKACTLSAITPTQWAVSGLIALCTLISLLASWYYGKHKVESLPALLLTGLLLSGFVGAAFVLVPLLRGC